MMRRVRDWIAPNSRADQPASAQSRSYGRYRRIAISGISGASARLIAGFAGLISIPLVIGHLGKEHFALWMIISSLIAWLQLVEFGVGAGLINAISESLGREDEMADRYLGTAIWSSSAASATALLLLFALAPLIPWAELLNTTDPAAGQLAQTGLLMAGLVYLIGIPFSLTARALQALQYGHVVNTVSILVSLATLASLAIGVVAGAGLLGLILASSLCMLAGHLVCWRALVRLQPNGWRFGRHFSRVAASRLLASCVPLLAFQIGAILVNQLVNLIVAQVSGLGLVADYNVIQKIYLAVFLVGASASAPFYPAIREAIERRDVEWSQQAAKTAIFVRSMAVCSLGIFAPFLGDWIIASALGVRLESPMSHAGWVAVAICLVLASISSTLSEILLGLDSVWPQTILVGISAAVSILLMWWLVPCIGVPGVYIAMAASTIVPIAAQWLLLQRQVGRSAS